MIRIAAALSSSALLLAPVPASAEQCWGGYSCADVARATVSYKAVRDCSNYFLVRPERKAELNKIMDAVRHRPMAGVFKNAVGEDDMTARAPEPMSDEDCQKPARMLLSGSPLGYFLAVRPEAMSRLGNAR
ncbi:MAG: hypothetical protein P4L98_19875 [Ancalomicrobiaceae bacterium]|nr:hypothetical protein [Ancalomicrobiaceae bacterium]